MSGQRRTERPEYLALVSASLSRSLSRCRLLVEDCRAHLAPANSNEEPFMLGGGKGEEDRTDR